MLPFEPEELESLQMRFPIALIREWDATHAHEDRPGLYRAYVFDFHHKLRLLISKDIFHPGDKAIIHISASWYESTGSMLFSKAEDEVKKYYKLLGGTGYLKLIGITPAGVIHWIVDEAN